MILMWLGSFALIVFSYLATQKYLNQRLSPLQSKFLVTKAKESDVALVLRSLSVVAMDVSPLKTIFTAIAKLNTQVGKERESLIQLCMASVGYWWTLILASLYLSLNGGFLLGLSLLALIPFLIPQTLRRTFYFVGCIGLFLLGSELALKNSSILQTYLGTSDFAFFLADGRWPAVFALLGLGLVFGILVRIELGSLFLAMALLVSNNISLNGAIALVAGELIGMMLFTLSQAWRVDEKTRSYVVKFAGAGILGLVIGLFVALQVRSYFVFSFSGERGQYQDKLMTLIFLVAVVLFIQTAVQMLWGHFAIRNNKVETSAVHYYPSQWMEWGLLSLSQAEFVEDGLNKRLSEIKYHAQGVKSLEAGKIPEQVLARLKTEEEELSRILNDWRI